MLHWSQLKGFSPAKDRGDGVRACVTPKTFILTDSGDK